MSTASPKANDLKQQITRVFKDNLLIFTIYGVILIMVIFASLSSPFFLSTYNLITLLKQATVLGILAVGQSILIISGAIDLSMGSTVTLISLVVAGIMDSREPLVIPMVLFGLFIGTGIGFIHGLLTTKLKLEPFIVTLATFSIIQGIAYAYTTVPKGGITPELSELLYYGQLGPIPLPVIYFFLIFILVYVLLKFTKIGRNIYAIGGDAEVARRSGIKVEKIKIIRYTFVGLLVSIAALIATGRMGIGDPLAGQGMEFDAITASVIGGISFMGGRGSLIGTLGGVFLLGLINNIMVMSNVNMYYQLLIKGIIVILAVAIYKQKK